MALRLYEVDLGGGRTATLRLSEEDARATYGDRARPVDEAPTQPATAPPAPTPADEDAAAKARTAPNKARTPDNK